MSTLTADQHLAGHYSTTQAYRFIKGLLNLPKGVLIYRCFFLLFFKRKEDLWEIRFPKEFIIEFFKKEKLEEEAKEFRQIKLEKPAFAKESLPGIISEIDAQLIKEAKAQGLAA